MNRKENVAKLIENLRVMIQADTGLRNSQKKALQQFLDNTDTPERGIFNLATGVGKTRIMSMLALAHLQSNPNSRVVVGIPNTDLFQQEIDAFQEYRDFQEEQRKKLKLPALNVSKQLDMGVFNKDDKNTSSQIIFTSYHSLENFSQQVQKEDTGLLLLDEAHHVVSDRRAKTVNSFTDALHYGMTATPWYSPERNVENVLGKVIAKISIRDAIQDKEPALAEYKNVLMVSNLSVDLSDVKKDSLGNYKEEDYCDAILHAMRGNSANSGNEENWQEAHRFIAREVARRYRDCVDEHIGPWNGKKCLINCRSQEEADIQAEELNNLLGPTVARVHTSDNCDDQTITDFKEGNLPIVCQVGKLTEGFDMPNLDMTINYPTASLVREAQGAARCLRLPKLDSRTPGILPKKMGLVVDIAFKHPAYDNIVDAIRQNGQVLFQDMDGVGSPVIQHTDERLQTEELDEKELTNLRKERSHKNDERLGFTIVSNIQELQRLTREADKLKDERYIPPKREGMWSSVDLGKAYGKAPILLRTWLEEAFKNKEVFYNKSDIKHEHRLPLVEYVKNAKGESCYCLHESPEALKSFEELHPKLLKSQKNKKLPPKRDGMRSALELTKEYAKVRSIIEDWLESAFNDEEVFYLQSDSKHEHPLPLVEYVKPKTGQASYCLHEAPETQRRFEELHPELKIKRKREGMKSSADLAKIYRKKHTNLSDFLENACKQKAVFYLEKDVKHTSPFPLVELVISGSITCYCLHEAPEALEAFKEYVKKTYGEELKERNSTLRPTLQEASEKGEKTKQPVKAPNPPQANAKLVVQHRTKGVQNTANRSGPTI